MGGLAQIRPFASISPAPACGVRYVRGTSPAGIQGRETGRADELGQYPARGVLRAAPGFYGVQLAARRSLPREGGSGNEYEHPAGARVSSIEALTAPALDLRVSLRPPSRTRARGACPKLCGAVPAARGRVRSGRELWGRGARIARCLGNGRPVGRHWVYDGWLGPRIGSAGRPQWLHQPVQCE